MKRIETLSVEAKDVYLKILERAKVYGRCEWKCGILDCDNCPFNANCPNASTVERTEKEWSEWADEEVKDETN